jgi:hypothetical protein
MSKAKRKPRTDIVTKEKLLDEMELVESRTGLKFEVHKEEYSDFELVESDNGTLCTGTRKELWKFLKAFNSIYDLTHKWY